MRQILEWCHDQHEPGEWQLVELLDYLGHRGLCFVVADRGSTMSSLSTGGGRDLCVELRVCIFMSSHSSKVLLILWGLMVPSACERTRAPLERPEAVEAMNEPGGSQGAQPASGQAAPTGVGHSHYRK